MMVKDLQGGHGGHLTCSDTCEGVGGSGGKP